jgi:hypothetical protein
MYTISISIFVYRYWLPGRPVIMRGIAKDWPIRRAWTKENLTDTYGDLQGENGLV